MMKTRVNKKVSVGGWDLLESAMTSFESALKSRQSPALDWKKLHQALGSLPLDTEQYALCLNELNNAEKYLLANEPGAARFELSMLKSHLRSARKLLDW